MVEMSNSWVYGLPTERSFILFLVGSTQIFGPSTLEKGTTKLPISVDQYVCQEVNYQFFLKKIYKPFLYFT